MSFIKRPVHEFVCEGCEKDSSGFNNQRFCSTCAPIHLKEQNRIRCRRDYEKNSESIKARSRKWHRDNHVPNERLEFIKNLTPEEKKERERVYMHEYHIKYKDEARVSCKRWKKENPDKIKEFNTRYNKKHRAKITIRLRKWRNKNKEDVRDKAKKYCMKRRKEDMNVLIRDRLRGRVYHAFKHYSKTGKIKKSRDYGIDYEKIIEHLKPFPEDVSGYHIDHIRPLCSFDLTNPKEVEKAFAPGNHQWLTSKENMKKGKKIII